MRQYRIFYRRGTTAKFGQCQPFVHAGLYDKPQVNAAIAHMRDNPHVEGISLRIDDEQFNIIAFEQEAMAPNAFEFPVAPIIVEAPLVPEDFVGPAGDL